MIKETYFLNKMNERLVFAQFDFSQENVIFDKTDCMCVSVSVFACLSFASNKRRN